MIGKLGSVVLDCPDPRALAGFYATLLGGKVEVEEDWVELRREDGTDLAFQEAPQLRATRWPDPEHPQQFHLDVTVDDLESAQAQVLALGATLLDDGEGKRSWRVFADPAGHPFCLCSN
jgi:catechol 2,3-dioxygenase-like lactoylglutathione lyase family enzyme